MGTPNLYILPSMKIIKPYTAFLTLLIFLLEACKDDTLIPDNNNLLPNVGVNLQLNLNLPEYKNLTFPGNSFITTQQGINGIVIYNIDNSQYTAFEITDPNHAIQSCSKLSVNGITATCSCEDANAYNIVTGQKLNGEQGFALRRYRISRNGNILSIIN